MKRHIFFLATAAAVCASTSAMAGDVAVRAGTLHTVSAAPIKDGVVVVQGGKITAVGPAASVRIPDGMHVIEAANVTPGFVDAHSVVGLAGYMNQPHDQDQLEDSAPIQPQLRAFDAYNPREPLVQWVRELGVTTLHTGHGPGELVSGQTMIVKTRGNSVESALVRAEAMVAANLGPGAFADKGKSPGTRAKQMAMLRAALLKASEYKGGAAKAEKGRNGSARDTAMPTAAAASKEAWREETGPEIASKSDTGGNDKAQQAKDGEKGGRDLEQEALRDVLQRKVPLLVTAWRAQDIMSALRLKQEFNIDLVIDGGAEAYLVLDALKAAKVPVILHPTMARQSDELENASWTTAATLREAGIPFALQSGYEGYVPKTRVVLWEAAIAAANGLGPEPALASITLDAAKILKIADRVGSLEVGKDGDLVLFDGDPLEYTSHVTAVIIEGDVVSRQKR